MEILVCLKLESLKGKMKRKGIVDVVQENFVFLIFLVGFFVLISYYAYGYQDGAVFYEDFYAKEIANLINRAEPGTEFKLDISSLGKIADKHGKDINGVVLVDNVDNKVTVSLNEGKGTSFEFFNDVDVYSLRVEKFLTKKDSTHIVFSIKESSRRVEG